MGRQLRGELRLYANRLVVVVFALEVVVGVVALLVGQSYARDQIGAVADQRVMSCAELAVMEIPADECPVVQADQADSRESLVELAERIGPPAKSSTTPVGAAALLLGHASTLVGLVGLTLVAAVVLGGEAEIGLARARDDLYLRRSAYIVRCVGLVIVWLTMTAGVVAVGMAANRVIGMDVGWTGAADRRSSWSFLIDRLAGAVVVVTTFTVLLVALRRHLTSRARWFLAAGALAVGLVAMAATSSPFFPPSNAGWGVQRFQPDLLSFIDRFPLELTVDAPAPGSAGVVALALVVVVGLFAASMRQRPARG